MSIDLVFATGNSAKLAQLAFVISHLHAPIRVISGQERYGDAAAYEEIGQNAGMISLRGALDVAQRIGAPVVTEDTTFHVNYLNGAPGLDAGKYLKEKGRQGILAELGENSNRYARITSAVSWATPQGDTQTWVQTVRGHIARREWIIKGMPEWIGPSPENPLGGGYNAIFIPYGDTRTLAELRPSEGLQFGYREPNFCALVAFLWGKAARKTKR
jgi:XTP/dITP diphosphohydrolase